MRDYFVSFTLHLDPNKFASGQSAPAWLQFTANESSILLVEFDKIVTNIDPEKSTQCEFLEIASRQFLGN
jgi:hypothetical protein